MKKLMALAAIFLASSGVIAVPAATATEFVQRGSQPELRTLTGHVLDDRDAPVAKAIVYLKNTKNVAIKTYISEPDGSYRFSGLSSNIDYEVYAEHEGAHSDVKTLSGFDNRRQANITLRLKPK
ncbi:MAG TPA: carboxypeptidase-like regulatory domain-containing protein [Candidatus Angelobacter sp.]|jgi:hypothetical protein